MLNIDHGTSFDLDFEMKYSSNGESKTKIIDGVYKSAVWWKLKQIKQLQI